MKRIVPVQIISNCNDCPFCEWEEWNGVAKRSTLTCKKEEDRLLTEEEDEISLEGFPEWCPLEVAGD